MKKQIRRKAFIFKKFVINKYFPIGILGIFLTAVFLRFHDYGHRWVLASDQAGFAIIARNALKSGQLPLLGPFSSAGPFQTGGEWYWLVMIGKLLYFPDTISPWVFMGILSVFFVGFMIYMGNKLYSKNFGLLLGLLAAVSTGQIIQSSNLTNQTPLMLFSAFALFFAILYSREKSIKYIFLLGLSVGIAASIHLQGVALGIIILVTIVLNKVYSVRHLSALILGGLLPWIPVLYVDTQNNFYTVTNMYSYYVMNKNPISYDILGRRWLTFAGLFVPSAWSYTIGGIAPIGYLIIFSSGIFAFFDVWKKKITKEMLLIVLSLIGMIILLRYTRTPIFESYFVFIHPFVLIVTAWVIVNYYRVSKILGITFLCVICIGSMYKNYYEIEHHKSLSNRSNVIAMKEYLLRSFPDEKFSLYDYHYLTTEYTLPLTLLLYDEDRLDKNGRKIGISRQANEDESFPAKALTTEFPRAMIDLESSSSAELALDRWVSTDPDYMYASVQYWFKQSENR